MSAPLNRITANIDQAYWASVNLAEANPMTAQANFPDQPNDMWRRDEESHGQAASRLAQAAGLHLYYAVAPDMAARGVMGGYVQTRDWAEKNGHSQLVGLVAGAGAMVAGGTFGLLMDVGEMAGQTIVAGITAVSAVYHGSEALRPEKQNSN